MRHFARKYKLLHPCKLEKEVLDYLIFFKNQVYNSCFFDVFKPSQDEYFKTKKSKFIKEKDFYEKASNNLKSRTDLKYVSDLVKTTIKYGFMRAYKNYIGSRSGKYEGNWDAPKPKKSKSPYGSFTLCNQNFEVIKNGEYASIKLLKNTLLGLQKNSPNKDEYFEFKFRLHQELEPILENPTAKFMNACFSREHNEYYVSFCCEPLEGHPLFNTNSILSAKHILADIVNEAFESNIEVHEIVENDEVVDYKLVGQVESTPERVENFVNLMFENFQSTDCNTSSLDFNDGTSKPIPKRPKKERNEINELEQMLSRAKYGGKNYRKLQKELSKVTKKHTKRVELAHHINSKEASLKGPKVSICEKLNLTDMRKSPKAKQRTFAESKTEGKTKSEKRQAKPKAKCGKNEQKVFPNVKTLTRQQKKNVNRSLDEACLSKFFHAFEYKIKDRNGFLLKVNPAFTSQMCFNCSSIYKLGPCKTYCCPNCGFTAHRDQNAAWNILWKGLEDLGLFGLGIDLSDLKKKTLNKLYDFWMMHDPAKEAVRLPCNPAEVPKFISNLKERSQVL